MSLFDWFRCEYPLPVPAVQGCAFQTKSFECPFSEDYTLRADGTLWHTEYDVEERSDPDPAATGLLALMGRMKLVNEREVPCSDFSGEVAFQTDYGPRTPQGGAEGWVRFSARLVRGRLLRLELLEHVETQEEVARKRSTVLDEVLPQGAGCSETGRM